MPGDTTRAQQAEKARAAILEAAIPLFAHGYDSVAVQQIAAAAGCKHSLVMYHFGTKDALWEQAAQRLMEQFDQRHQAYFDEMSTPKNDRQKMQQLLLAFILSLRDLPAYGQILLCEGVQPSARLAWLHQHFFPSAFVQARFKSEKLQQVLMQATLLRSALAGALLYTVAAAPQIAQSAVMGGGDAPDEVYPMSDARAARLADMMTAFVFAEMGAGAA